MENSCCASCCEDHFTQGASTSKSLTNEQIIQSSQKSMTSKKPEKECNFEISVRTNYATWPSDQIQLKHNENQKGQGVLNGTNTIITESLHALPPIALPLVAYPPSPPESGRESMRGGMRVGKEKY